MKHRLAFALFLLSAALLFSQNLSPVYVTAAGKKYHLRSCRTITESKVTALERSAAEKAGYTACKVCKP